MKNANKKSLIPSDFIISSIDISNAINMEHDIFLQNVDEYVGIGALEKGCIFPAIVKIGNTSKGVYLFDMIAVIEISDAFGDDEDNFDIRKMILQKFFELANCIEKNNSTMYSNFAFKMQRDKIHSDEFLKKLWSCVDCMISE